MIRFLLHAKQRFISTSNRILRAAHLGWKLAQGNAPMPALPRRGQAAVTRAPGVYYVQGNPHDRFEIVARSSRQILPNLYADLVHALGERVVLVMGEMLAEDAPQQMLSFSPALETARLHHLLFDYGDVIAHHDNLEFTAQNAEKSGQLVLTAEKLILLQVSCPQRFIHTLAAHGLQRVPRFRRRPSASCSAGLNAVDEKRLIEFKLQLACTTFAFEPRLDLVH